MKERIEALFPQLRGSDYQITSPASDSYSCIAWAAGETTTWWWPGEPNQTYWPPGVPRSETLSAFQAAFETLGYVFCDQAELEPGYEKIAVFADAEGIPTHAARQLVNGPWSSKLGRMEDIEHRLDALSGAVYGSVVMLLKRPLPSLPSQVKDALLDKE
jgi:hypothetical protein